MLAMELEIAFLAVVLFGRFMSATIPVVGNVFPLDSDPAAANAAGRFTLGLVAKKFGGVRYADQFPGSDIGAKVNAAILDIGPCRGSGGGGTIVIPLGQYNFSTTIVKPKCINIRGQGEASTALNYTGNGVAIVVGDTLNSFHNGIISDLTLNGTGSSGTQTGMFLGADPTGTISPRSYTARGTRVENVTFQNLNVAEMWGSNAWETSHDRVYYVNNHIAITAHKAAGNVDITNSNASNMFVNTEWAENDIHIFSATKIEPWIVNSVVGENSSCTPGTTPCSAASIQDTSFIASGVHFENYTGPFVDDTQLSSFSYNVAISNSTFVTNQSPSTANPANFLVIVGGTDSKLTIESSYVRYPSTYAATWFGMTGTNTGPGVQALTIRGLQCDTPAGTVWSSTGGPVYVEHSLCSSASGVDQVLINKQLHMLNGANIAFDFGSSMNGSAFLNLSTTGTVNFAGVQNLNGGLKIGPSGSTIFDSRELIQSLHSCGTTSTCSNTSNGSYREIFGTIPLNRGAASLSNISPAFTSISRFSCTCTDQTQAAACKAVPASRSSVNFAGTNSDVLAYSCRGD